MPMKGYIGPRPSLLACCLQRTGKLGGERNKRKNTLLKILDNTQMQFSAKKPP